MTDVVRLEGPVVAKGVSTATLIKRDLWANAVVIGLLIVGMQVWSGFVPNYIMPSPLETASAMGKVLVRDIGDIAITLLRLFYAVAFSLVAGCLIGAAMAAVEGDIPHSRSSSRKARRPVRRK